jgi:hypothetical protein
MSTTPKRDGIFGELPAHRQAEDHQPSPQPRAGEVPPPASADEEDDFDDEPDKIAS